MEILQAEYSENTPSVSQIHEELLKTNLHYKKIVEQTSINPETAFNVEMVQYINEVVESTGGFKPLHHMGVLSAGTNPFTGNGINFIESPDKDAVMVTITDKGLLFLGTKAAHTFYWDNILYTLDLGHETLVLQIGGVYQLLISDPNFYYVFNKLVEGLKENGYQLLEFVQK